jgi:hypothetical protein
MPPLEIVAGWFLFSFLPAIIAPSRGRSFIGWFLISILISPLFALILVLALPSRGKVLADKDRQYGRVKDCPECAETVKSAARTCRFCGHKFA